MDRLSSTASVIAAIQLAGSIIKICRGYIKEVKDTKDEICELQETVTGLTEGRFEWSRAPIHIATLGIGLSLYLYISHHTDLLCLAITSRNLDCLMGYQLDYRPQPTETKPVAATSRSTIYPYLAAYTNDEWCHRVWSIEKWLRQLLGLSRLCLLFFFFFLFSRQVHIYRTRFTFNLTLTITR